MKIEPIPTPENPATYKSIMHQRFPGFAGLFMEKACPHHFFKNLTIPKDCDVPCTQCWLRPYQGEEYR